MKTVTEKGETGTGIRVTIILCLFYLWLSFPSILHAELRGAQIAYVESIREDEDGGKIHFPSTIFVDQVTDEIYIIDSKARIIIYTSDFFPLFTLDIRRGVESPLSLSVDKEGNLYVLQSPTKKIKRHRISVFNACLKWKRDIYLEGFEGAESLIMNRIAVDKHGNIYVVCFSYPGVLILNNMGELQEIISPEEEEGTVVFVNVTIDEKGQIYLVSEIEGRIYVYDENRKFLFKFGEKGGSSGKLSRPTAVGVDDLRGRIYVVDYMRHTISVYSTKDGTYLFEFGGLGWGEGWFQHPKDIAVETNGRILVADTFNNRIEVLKPTD
jgi:DNA-binding beta-propeller fold protein YncE